MTTTVKLSDLTGDYVLDNASTRIGFVARHAMATKVRGQFDEFDGRARLDGDDPSKSSTQLTIQAKSVQTRNRQRDEHLRGKFLDIGNHPTINRVLITSDEPQYRWSAGRSSVGCPRPGSNNICPQPNPP